MENMLLPDNIHPEHSIYYTGAMVLEALLGSENRELSIMDLYEVVNRKKAMTMPVLALSLDWLYLVDAALLNDAGKVELCI